MNNKFKTKATCTLLCLTMLVFTVTGCSKSNEASSKADATQKSSKEVKNVDKVSKEETKNPRIENEKQLKESEELYKKNSNDQDTILKYAKALYALGDFDKAKEVLEKAEKPSPDIVQLLAELEYMSGNYTEAEKLYKTLIKDHNEKYGLAAKAGLQMTYYHTNQYNKAKEELSDEKDLQNPFLDMMKAFDKDPYNINWNGKERIDIPFITTDPLPVVPIEINGVKVNAVIDTGGSTLLVDETLKSKLNAQHISDTEGKGAGGSIDISLGKADSMKLGEVDIENIPITLIPFDGFKNVFNGYAENVHAVIGTNVLEQFIATIDYPTGQLTLMPRNEEGHKQLDNVLQSEKVLEVPFKLSSTHHMFAKGSINGREGFNMFVDSGLANIKGENGAGIELSKETMDIFDIKMPKLEQAPEGYGGIGGDNYKEGLFDLDSYSLGNLKTKQGIASFTTNEIVSEITNDFGFVVDALISHVYLKQYKWTLDFDNGLMKFYE